MRNKVIIGTWPLSGDFGIVNLSQVEETLITAFNLGYLEYDTAPNYGNGFSEFSLGKLFKNNKDVSINTKIGNSAFCGKSFDIDDIKKSFEQSLKRLQRETINTIYLHNPRNDLQSYDEVLSYMESLKQDGVVKNIGLSVAKGFSYIGILDLNFFDCIQDDINILHNRDCTREGFKGALISRSPLASGLLADKFDTSTKFENDDHRSSWLKGKRLVSLLKQIEIIKDNFDVDLMSLSRKYLLQDAGISKVIFGVKHKSHVIDFNNDIKSPEIPDDYLTKINQLQHNNFNLDNNQFISY